MELGSGIPEKFPEKEKNPGRFPEKTVFYWIFTLKRR